MAGQITAEHLGMTLTIDDLDHENKAFFGFCARGEFRLQRNPANGLFRYPPTTRCPWTGDAIAEWVGIEPRGTVYSYNEVHHAIQPAFKAVAPYMLLLVELDTQKGQPSKFEGLRIAGNLVTADGEMAPPELVKQVGIGSRMQMVFKKLSDEIALPMWTLDDSTDQSAKPWRYPQE